jgi:hypothetical protein
MRTPSSLVFLLAAACGGHSSSNGGTDAPATSGDGAIAVDAGVDAPLGVDAGFDIPLEQWTWVDVPGMKCGNGSPTGIAINPSTRSRRVAFLFAGGGACWEAGACFILKTATNLDGYNAATFAGQRAVLDSNFLLQRADATSEFGDATWVFVPYCTGDLHAGTREQDYGVFGKVEHVGALNVDAMLAHVQAHVPAPSEVFAVGISAGGYGVAINWERIAAAFPGVTTHVLADSAPLVPVDWQRWGTLMQAWAPRFPAGCTTCKDRLDNLATYYLAHPPGGRYGLLATLQDNVIATFWGLDAATMEGETRAAQAAMTGNEAAFVVAGNTHVQLGTPDLKTSTNVVLRAWVKGWATGIGFANAGP